MAHPYKGKAMDGRRRAAKRYADGGDVGRSANYIAGVQKLRDSSGGSGGDDANSVIRASNMVPRNRPINPGRGSPRELYEAIRDTYNSITGKD